MEVLVQNNGDCPFYVPIKIEVDGQVGIDRSIIFGEHQVTKISEEIYQKFIITSSFFKMRIEDGTIRILNANMLGEKAVESSAALNDLAYAKYVDLMKKIRSAGGLANKDFAPYLNADGTPKLSLLHANFGRNIDPEVSSQFRTRFVAEAGEGMHEDTVRLPGGAKVETGARDVDVRSGAEDNETNEDDEKDEDVLLKRIAEVKALDLESLKAMATAMELEFAEDITARKLTSLIIRAIKEEGK